jgi:hypothetical protein
MASAEREDGGAMPRHRRPEPCANDCTDDRIIVSSPAWCRVTSARRARPRRLSSLAKGSVSRCGDLSNAPFRISSVCHHGCSFSAHGTRILRRKSDHGHSCRPVIAVMSPLLVNLASPLDQYVKSPRQRIPGAFRVNASFNRALSLRSGDGVWLTPLKRAPGIFLVVLWRINIILNQSSCPY